MPKKRTGIRKKGAAQRRVAEAQPKDKGDATQPAIGRGRHFGARSKLTRNTKIALELAFEGIGGVPALIRWARRPENTGEFYKLWVKLLPIHVVAPPADGEPGAGGTGYSLKIERVGAVSFDDAANGRFKLQPPAEGPAEEGQEE